MSQIVATVKNIQLKEISKLSNSELKEFEESLHRILSVVSYVQKCRRKAKSFYLYRNHD